MQVVALKDLGVRRQRLHLGALGQLLAQLLGERLEEPVERLLQLAHQALDLLVVRAARERLHQRLLDLAEVALGDGELALLDVQGGIPQQLLDLADGSARGIVDQPPLGRPDGQRHHHVVEIVIRPVVDLAQRADHRKPGGGIEGQLLAQLHQGARHRVVEDPLGQDRARRVALAALAERVARHQADLDRQAGPGVRRQVVEAHALGAREADAGQGQVQFHRRHAWVVQALNERGDGAQAVVVLGQVFQAQRRPLGAPRRRQELHARRHIGQERQPPGGQFLAALLDRQALARPDFQAHLVGVRGDRGERRLLVTDDQGRHAAATL